jgi:hypothetical protein
MRRDDPHFAGSEVVVGHKVSRVVRHVEAERSRIDVNETRGRFVISERRRPAARRIFNPPDARFGRG